MRNIWLLLFVACGCFFLALNILTLSCEDGFSSLDITRMAQSISIRHSLWLSIFGNSMGWIIKRPSLMFFASIPFALFFMSLLTRDGVLNILTSPEPFSMEIYWRQSIWSILLVMHLRGNLIRHIFFIEHFVFLHKVCWCGSLSSANSSASKGSLHARWIPKSFERLPLSSVLFLQSMLMIF